MVSPMNLTKDKKKKSLKFPTKKLKSIDSAQPFKFGGGDVASKEEVYSKKLGIFYLEFYQFYLAQYRDFNFKINYGNNLFV